MKTIVHVSQPNIRLNTRDGSHLPVLTAKDHKRNRYGHTAIIRDANGHEVARLVYRPNHPLSCGARVWLETTYKVDVLDEDNNLITESNVKECYMGGAAA